mgnify:CR=1 FL=1|jgi:ABC-type sugar transport system, permease component
MRRMLVIRQSALILALSALSLTVIVPLYLMFVNSLKTPAEANKLELGFPAAPEWGNYVKVFKTAKLGLSFQNSVILTFISVAVIVVASAAAAFVIQRRKDAYSRWLNLLVLIGLVVPPAIVPVYQVLKFLDLNGTLTGIVLINVAVRSPLSIFLCYQFLKSISREIDEAAIIDGCGKHRLFFGIVFPLLSPILVTIVIFNAVYVWNDFIYVLYFLSSGTKMTLPLTLYLFTGQFSTQWNLVFADIVIISAPLLLIYFVLQRYIIAGLTAGATKG